MTAPTASTPMLHAALVHVLIVDSGSPRHTAPHHAIALMLDALKRAESDPGGLFEGICNNFSGRLAHKLLRAAGFEVTPEVNRRIR